MITTTATAKLLHDLIAGHDGRLWLGFRFQAEDAAAFATDQETALADFLTIENRNGHGDVLWHVIGTVKPTRPSAEFDRLISPSVAAMAAGSWLKAPRDVCCSERWAAILSRAAA
jgi:hypothetical protein